MIDPKEYVIVVGPKKGACYICGKDLEKSASLQVQANVPLTKFKKVVGRACPTCATEIRELLDLRIAAALKGVYDA